MTNPFRKHASNLFGSRGCDIDAALTDAHEMIQAMANEDRPAAMTAVMLVVNTAANAFDQARGTSPEKLAILDLIRSEIENWASSSLDTSIEGWMDNNMDDRLDNWASNQFDLDDHIEGWMDNNLETKVSDAIDNLDLVVRTR